MDDAPTTSSDLPPVPEIVAREAQVVHVVEAIYEDGVIKPLVPLNLPTGTPIILQIVARDHTPGSAPPAAPVPGVTKPRIQLPNFGGWLKASLPGLGLHAAFTRVDMLLLAFGLLIYSL